MTALSHLRRPTLCSLHLEQGASRCNCVELSVFVEASVVLNNPMYNKPWRGPRLRHGPIEARTFLVSVRKQVWQPNKAQKKKDK